MSSEVAGDEGRVAGPDLGDALDPMGRSAARRGWMRHYFRSSVKSRLADLDSLAQAELTSLQARDTEEPAP
jgi:hypothetical protein